MKKHLTMLLMTAVCIALQAQNAISPSVNLTTYYSEADGKTGNQLRQALESIISDGFTSVSYSNLATLLKYADTYQADGTHLIDIYTDCEIEVSGSQLSWNTQCSGTASQNVGCNDALNREHTVPQSWFSEAAPMKSDAFHIYATDATCNGHRSNYPYGECSGGTSYHGSACDEMGRLGRATSFSDLYSGTVYEVQDEYKGDIARTYFYMATRYASNCAGWTGGMFGSSTQGLSDYAVALMLKWHRQDPVSDKERIRNEVIYGNSSYNPSSFKQHNRNPFIDYPELVEYIWGNRTSQTFSLADAVSSYSDDYDPSAPDDGCHYTERTLTEQFATAAVNTAYQGTRNLTAEESDCGLAWEIFFGNVSGSNAIDGNSCNMRLYTTSNYGYIRNVTAVGNIAHLAFEAKAVNSNNAQIIMLVEASEDGSQWTTLEHTSAATVATAYSYDLTGSFKYIKIGIAPASAKPQTGNAQLTVDNIVIRQQNLEAVALEGAPEKTAYHTGDAFLTDGLTTMASFAGCLDGTDVSSEAEWTVVPAELDEQTEQVSVTVTYRGVSATEVYAVTVTAPSPQPEGPLFYESFDTNNYTGGNDGSWSGNIASGTVHTDNEGWTLTAGYGASECIRLGTGSKQGVAQTPMISYTGDAVMTFKAAAWNASSEKTTLLISATSGTLDQTQVTLLKGEWTEYTVRLTGITESTQITFAATTASGNRFFLDEVMLVADAAAPEVLIGDVNMDGAVDVSDISTLAEYIFGNTPAQFCAEAADANEDGAIDVSDISTIAEIIFGN